MKNVIAGQFGGFMKGLFKTPWSVTQTSQESSSWNVVVQDLVVYKKRNTTDAGLKLSSMTLFYDGKRTPGRFAGFTLIELLVVVLIIGILAAIAVPQYEIAVEKARLSDAIIILRSLKQAADLCILAHPESDNDTGVCRFNGLDLDIPGVVFEEAGDYGAGKFFEYSCDAPDCRNPCVNPINTEYQYFFCLSDQDYANKSTCYGDNAKGQRLCKALGGKPIEVSDERIIYEL